MTGTPAAKAREISLEANHLSRRQFVKQALLGLGSFAFVPIHRFVPFTRFPQADQSDRVNVGDYY
jgi:hypothetical protein